jgi:hypothetical protein
MDTLNIELEENVDFTLSLTYRDDLTNLPIDITDYNGILEVRPNFGSSIVLLSLDVGGGEISLGGPSGAIDIVFRPEYTNQVTQSPNWTRGVYDLILTDGAGKKVKILKGFITIARSTSLDYPSPTPTPSPQ